MNNAELIEKLMLDRDRLNEIAANLPDDPTNKKRSDDLRMIAHRIILLIDQAHIHGLTA